jgi:catechol 2,3-dioxygenase-like lactoylglutathione lyase family enzyme
MPMILATGCGLTCVDRRTPTTPPADETDHRTETTMTEQTGTRISQVHTIGIPVTDQDRALSFYAETLGFDVVRDVSYGGGQRWVELAPAGAATTIALVPASSTAPAGVETGIRFATHDATGDHTDLLARGVDVDPEVIRWPGVPAMFGLRDPDGNRLVIVEQA